MKYRAGITVTVVFLALATAFAQPQPEPATLAGRTRSYSKGKYDVMPNVEFTVYRTGRVAHGKSDDDGKFGIPVPPGSPFMVVFIGPDDYLPELQALSGESKTQHLLTVSLITAQDAREQKINPYKHVESIIGILEAHGVNPQDPTLRQLNEIKKRFG